MKRVLSAIAFHLLALPGLLVTTGAALGADPPVATAPLDPVTIINPSAAAAAVPGVKKEDISATPVQGVFEVRRGADIVYMSGDGQYVFTGDLYNVPSRSNLTEAHRRVLRQKLIDSIPESQMVIFSPPTDPKYTITVFTDVDCGYCRELHRQIAEYNRLGVRIRYIFYPRTGPNTESWHKAEEVWCSPDRKEALTRAKLGQPLNVQPCGATPVEREYEMGRAIGLEGTPGIVTANGALLGGYLPPAMLVAELEKQQHSVQQ